MQLKPRRPTRPELPRLWALNDLPNVGSTANAAMPLHLPVPAAPPAAFPDLADVEASFIAVGGDFLVMAEDGAVVGMGGFKPRTSQVAEVLRVRVHPARRRLGLGRALMDELERCARRAGFSQLRLDTATNQPEAMAFYRGLGYQELGQETRPEWTWTLVYFGKSLT